MSGTSSFPTAVDTTFVNPSANNPRNSPSLSAGQTLQNDAILSLENKVGADGSATTTTHDYKLSGVTGSDKAVSKTGSETLTNKTLTSPTLNTPTFSAGAIPTAAIAADAITAPKLLYGNLRNRQGGTTGAGSWTSPGTSNTDTTATDIFTQAGSATSSAGGGFTVTFPTAFSQIPLVFATYAGTAGTVSVGYMIELYSVSTTSFSYKVYNTSNTLVAVSFTWIAIGQ